MEELPALGADTRGNGFLPVRSLQLLQMTLADDACTFAVVTIADQSHWQSSGAPMRTMCGSWKAGEDITPVKAITEQSNVDRTRASTSSIRKEDGPDSARTENLSARTVIRVFRLFRRPGDLPYFPLVRPPVQPPRELVLFESSRPRQEVRHGRKPDTSTGQI